jgi:hypothetical protein
MKCNKSHGLNWNSRPPHLLLFYGKMVLKRATGWRPFCPFSPHAIVQRHWRVRRLGAVWLRCSPGALGRRDVADRFVQIQPKVLIAVDGYAYGGKSFDKTGEVGQLCQLAPVSRTYCTDSLAEPGYHSCCQSRAIAEISPLG